MTDHPAFAGTLGEFLDAQPSDTLNGVPTTTPIIVRGDPGDPEEWTGPLGAFLIANRDADLSDCPADEITACLRDGRVYTGGGGAAATYTVERAG